MAGRTRINAINYPIEGGRTRINAINYPIVGGRVRIGGSNYPIELGKLTIEQVFSNNAITNTLYSALSASGSSYKRDINFTTAGTYFHFNIRATSTTAYWWKICEVSSNGTTATIVNTWEHSFNTSQTAYTISGTTLSTSAYGLSGAVFALQFNYSVAQLRTFFSTLTNSSTALAGKTASSAFTLSATPFTGFAFTHAGTNASSGTTTTYTTYFGVAKVTSSGSITSVWGIGFTSKNDGTTATASSYTNKGLLYYTGSAFWVSINGTTKYSAKAASIWSADV